MELALWLISIVSHIVMAFANHVSKVTILTQIKNVRPAKMAAFMKQVFAYSALLPSPTLQTQRTVLSMLVSKQTL